MKIYKFRKLTSKIDYCRLKEIIETGDFWCSNFWELNDPMEGVFSIRANLAKKISEIYGEKGQYKICSFSGAKAFVNPIMWGYYTGGFKGAAIEIVIDDQLIKKIDYNDSGIVFNNGDLENEVKKILLNKNIAWKHEDEYRYLEKQKDNYSKIGEINAIYFGSPYDNLENSEQIQMERKSFIQYKKYKEKIVKIVGGKNIKCFKVKIENGVVKKSTRIFNN